MTNETIPFLAKQTAETWERLEKEPLLKIEGKSRVDNTWLDLEKCGSRPEYWRFLRVAPEPEVPPEKWEAGDVLKAAPSGIEVRFLSLTDPGAFRGTIVGCPTRSWKLGDTCDGFAIERFRLHHRPTADERRRADNARLEAEWKKPKEEGGGFEVEFLNPISRKWVAVKDPCWEPTYTYRRKPKPTYAPWTSDDMKPGMWVTMAGAVIAIICWNDGYVHLGNGKCVSFAYLLRDYTRLDKSPCGKEVK
jgi:hypothetical protein